MIETRISIKNLDAYIIKKIAEYGQIRFFITGILFVMNNLGPVNCTFIRFEFGRFAYVSAILSRVDELN